MLVKEYTFEVKIKKTEAHKYPYQENIKRIDGIKSSLRSIKLKFKNLSIFFDLKQLKTMTFYVFI